MFFCYFCIEVLFASYKGLNRGLNRIFIACSCFVVISVLVCDRQERIFLFEFYFKSVHSIQHNHLSFCFVLFGQVPPKSS